MVASTTVCGSTSWRRSTRKSEMQGATDLQGRIARLFADRLNLEIPSAETDLFAAATVTWVARASCRPPLIMAAVRPDSNVFACLRQSGFVALHILGSGQEDMARRFFEPTRALDGGINGEPFQDGATTAPILRNAPAYVECRVRRILDDLGDHVLVVLEVLEAGCREQGRPLTIADSPWEYGG